MTDEAARLALEKIANNIAFAARMKIRSANGPSERSKAIGAEEAALQFIKEIRALNATPATGGETEREYDSNIEPCNDAEFGMKP